MVKFRFSTEGEFMLSLEEGLKKLLSPEKLRLRYLDGFIRNILNDRFKENHM